MTLWLFGEVRLVGSEGTLGAQPVSFLMPKKGQKRPGNLPTLGGGGGFSKNSAKVHGKGRI